jgi:hypothetical protein
MSERERRKYGAVLLEMFSITLAIVLGFAITRWDDVRGERERAASALERISQELEANLAELDQVAPYHDSIAAAVDSLVSADGDATVTLSVSSIHGWRGLRPPRLRTSSFDVSISAGALEYVDFADADAVAGAYESIRDVAGVVDEVLGAFLRGELRSTRELQSAVQLLDELTAIASDQIEQALAQVGRDDP